MILRALIPAKTAWRVNSRCRRLSVADRISRASKGQPKHAHHDCKFDRGQVVPQDVIEQHQDREDRQCHDDVVDGHQGTIEPAARVTRNEPDRIEMIRERNATTMPNVSVLRIANVACQKRSCPVELVPNQYSDEGGRSGGTTNWSSGFTGEKNSGTRRRR